MERSTYLKMRELEDSHWWFVARRKLVETMLRQLGLPGAARLLEVGCGTGGNLAMLGQFGELLAVEYEAEAAQLAADRDVAPVFPGALPDGMPDFERSFDLILALDVIEHVEQDAASLVTLTGLLNPAGRLLVTVPAFPFLWSQHDQENHHFRRYRKGDMRRLARECNLRLDYVSYFNFWLFPPVAAIRLIRKIWPYQEAWRDMRMPAAPVNGVLTRLFASERRVIGRVSLPFGISLMAVFSKGR